MSMGKTDERLIQFLEQNPQYFTGPKDEKTIRSDLRKGVETYARALDPDAYDELTERVLEFNARARASMKEKMGQLLREKERQTSILQEAKRESELFENKIDKLREEMRKFRLVENHSAPVRRGGGLLDYLSASLDIIGIGFLYAGFIVTDQINLTLVVIGFGLLLAGLYLYVGRGDQKKASSARSNEIYEKFQARFEHIKEVWDVKKIAIQYRIKSSREELSQIDRQIEHCLQRMGVDSD